MKLARSRLLSQTLHKEAGVPWYLAGGISRGDCIAAYQFVNRASRSDAMINLNDPSTHKLVDGASVPYWTTEYGIFNGEQAGGSIYGNQYTIANGYLVSDITPSNTGQWSFFIEYQYAGNANNSIFGSRSSQIFGLYPARTGLLTRFANFVSDTTYSYVNTPGQVHYMGVSDRKCYDNGVLVKTLAPAVSDNLAPLWVLGNNGGGASCDRSAVRRLAIYSSPITDAQMLAVTHQAVMDPNLGGPTMVDYHENSSIIYVKP